MCPEKETTNSYILSLRNWRNFIPKSQLFLEDKPCYIITATEQISCMGHCNFVPLKKKRKISAIHKPLQTRANHASCLCTVPVSDHVTIMLKIIDSCCHPQEYKFYTKKTRSCILNLISGSYQMTIVAALETRGKKTCNFLQ